jgi:Ca-activated chloride channel family protein
VRNTAAPARDVNQPLPLPHNVSNLAVGGRNVPEPGLGLLLAAAAAMTLVVARRKRRTPHGRS